MKNGLRILLVEDHDMVSYGVKQTLEQSDLQCEILTCENADFALKTLCETPIDLVLLDLILKAKKENHLGDGDELLKEIRRREVAVKTIILSKIDTLSILDYVVNNLQAEGYILKSRTSLKELVPAIKTVFLGKRYLSESVEKLLDAYDQILDIDYVDRVMLTALARGYKQGELVWVLSDKGVTITLSGIEKRIKKLKHRFGSQTLVEMIAIAIKEGIVYP